MKKRVRCTPRGFQGTRDVATPFNTFVIMSGVVRPTGNNNIITARAAAGTKAVRGEAG